MFNLQKKMSIAMELYEYPDELIFSARSREGMTEDTEGICTLLSDIFTKAIKQGWAWEQNRQQALESAFRTAVLIHNCPDGHNQQLMSAILKECSGRFNPATVIHLVMTISLLTVQENVSKRERDIAEQMEHHLLGRQDATAKICRTLSISRKGKTRCFHTVLEVHPTPVWLMHPDTLRWIDQCMEMDDLIYLLRHYPDTEQQLQLYDRAMKHNLPLLHRMTSETPHGRGLMDLRQSISDGLFLGTPSGRPAGGTLADGSSPAAGREETEVRRLNHQVAELSAALHAKESEIEQWKSTSSCLYDLLAKQQEATAALTREKEATEQSIAAFVGRLRQSQLPPDITDHLPEEVEHQLAELAERIDSLFRSRIVQVNQYDHKTAVYQGPTVVSTGMGTLNFYSGDPGEEPVRVTADK